MNYRRLGLKSQQEKVAWEAAVALVAVVRIGQIFESIGMPERRRPMEVEKAGESLRRIIDLVAPEGRVGDLIGHAASQGFRQEEESSLSGE